MIEVIQGYVDRASIHKEDGVKRVVRRILNHFNFFEFMPPANAFGKSGISDILTLGNGNFVAIECKYGRNKPTEMQLEFGRRVEEAGGLFLIINDSNLTLQMVRAVHFMQTGEDPDADQR